MVTAEPVITVNGHELSIGQAMALRVAIESFAGELAAPDSLGEDLHGRLMQQGYMDRINEVRRLIYGEAPGLAHNT